MSMKIQYNDSTKVYEVVNVLSRKVLYKSKSKKEAEYFLAELWLFDRSCITI